MLVFACCERNDLGKGPVKALLWNREAVGERTIWLSVIDLLKLWMQWQSESGLCCILSGLTSKLLIPGENKTKNVYKALWADYGVITCSYRLPLWKWIIETARMPLPFGQVVAWDKGTHFNSLQSISTCREMWACTQGWVCVPECFQVPNMLQCRHSEHFVGTQCFLDVFSGSAQLCTQSWGEDSDQGWCMQLQGFCILVYGVWSSPS